MTTIGAGWLKEDKNGEHYISCKIDEALLPLTLTPDKLLSIRPNKNKTAGSQQPDYYLDLYIPKQRTETTSESEDFPF